MDKELGRPATIDEIWRQSHGKKGTRPLDRLLNFRGGEGSVADGFKEIDLQNNIEWVDSRLEESLKSYQEFMKEKYGNDNSKHPLFDQDSWIEAFEGKKKSRLYGFNDISDTHFLMTGKPSMQSTGNSSLHVRNEEVQRLNEKIAQLQQEKETERLEKEKERVEKLTMLEQIEENIITNPEMKEANTEMEQQVEFLFKNISKNFSTS